MPSLSAHTTQGVDEAAVVAEATFRKAAAFLDGEIKDISKQKVFWPLLVEMVEGEGNDMQW